jgi:hypothetical protein
VAGLLAVQPTNGDMVKICLILWQTRDESFASDRKACSGLRLIPVRWEFKFRPCGCDWSGNFWHIREFICLPKNRLAYSRLCGPHRSTEPSFLSTLVWSLTSRRRNTFHADRNLIEGFLMLNPSWTHIAYLVFADRGSRQ